VSETAGEAEPMDKRFNGARDSGWFYRWISWADFVIHDCLWISHFPGSVDLSFCPEVTVTLEVTVTYPAVMIILWCMPAAGKTHAPRESAIA
jgi:hypothetical protein